MQKYVSMRLKHCMESQNIGNGRKMDENMVKLSKNELPTQLGKWCKVGSAKLTQAAGWIGPDRGHAEMVCAHMGMMPNWQVVPVTKKCQRGTVEAAANHIQHRGARVR